MLRLLVIAPCNRDDVGEARIAYEWASRVSRHQDVTLLTYRKRGHASAIDQLPDAHVVEWLEPPLMGRYERFNSMLRPAYIPFYFQARRWIKAALSNGARFDVAHQPVPAALRYPSPLAGLGIPYAIGPVGGSLASPPGFEDDTAPWYVGLRALDRARLRHDPLVRRTFAEASCVLGIAPYVRETLHDVRLRRFEVMLDSGIDALPEATDRTARSEPLRLLYVGRLVRTKGARDLIRALGLVRDLPVVLDVVGVGSDRETCAELVDDLGLRDRVAFHGRLNRSEVDEFYRNADVFVFPSYREAGGIVVTEAMSHGLPVIVSNRGGPGNTVDDTCGIRVPAVTPEQYTGAIAGAIRQLAGDAALRHRLGACARDRIAELTVWDHKIDRITEIYKEIAAVGT
jgi:glycosyltransferase involved in cell wall biosynthesis